MKPSQLLVSGFFAVVFLSSCKKEIETQVQIKEVEKVASWREVTSLYGLSRVILSTGSNGQSIYLQQPNAFTRFTDQRPLKGLVTAVGSFPTDVNVRLPIGRELFAYPESDTTLVILRNNEPLNYRCYLNLRRFDPLAIRFTTRLFSLSK